MMRLCLLAALLLTLAGCGGEDRPRYLDDVGDGSSTVADAMSPAEIEDATVADAEKAEAAKFLPASRKAKN